MNRREFIIGAVTAAPSPFSAYAQSERVRRIGVLTALAQSDPEAKIRITTFERELQRFGWIINRNVIIDYRLAASDSGRYRAFARELVELQPDVIVGSTKPVVAELLQVTRTIPVVFLSVTDPIGSGFVTSLPHPGGNATGFTIFKSSMCGKWIGLLKRLPLTFLGLQSYTIQIRPMRDIIFHRSRPQPNRPLLR